MLGILILLGASPAASPPGAIRTILPEMIRVPAGRFVMGSPAGETEAVQYPAAAAARERPQRTIAIAAPFAIARTEVTRDAFARFVAATAWRPSGPCAWLADAHAKRWVADGAHDWLHPGFAQTGRHPVVCVSLADAAAYARWLSDRTGRHFRLPSGVEWEYAARAGTTGAFWWRGAADVCRFANVAGRERARADGRDGADVMTYMACDDGHASTAPVGSYRANPWGLHDMLGNVWEWTLDCLDPGGRVAPTDLAPRPAGGCASHIDRGASWTNSPKYVRLAVQHPDLAEARTAVLGFRLIEELR